MRSPISERFGTLDKTVIEEGLDIRFILRPISILVNMKSLYVVFAIVALSTAQKSHKQGKHAKQAYVAAATGQGGQYSSSGHQEQPSYYGGNQGSHQSYQGSGHGKVEAAKNYPHLLSDTRTLNSDGTINFKFQADNGLQQGESVDEDGTRRGFYSYPGADGKPITVKYTAGKNGFIAEGDHLPKQPQSASHSDKAESYTPNTPKGRQSRQDSGQYDPRQHEQYQYDPSLHESDNYSPQSGSQSSHGGSAQQGGHQAGGSGAYNRPTAGQYSGGGGGSHHSSPYSSGGSSSGGGTSFAAFGDFPQNFGNDYPSIPSRTQGGSGGARPAYSGGQGAGRFPGGGSPSYSSISGPAFGGAGSQQSYNSGAPSYNGVGSNAGGFMYSAANPYQGAGGGPVNANFDLGNSGHFSLNFAPGNSQEYNTGGGIGQGAPQNYAGAPGAPRAPGTGGARGQY